MASGVSSALEVLAAGRGTDGLSPSYGGRELARLTRKALIDGLGRRRGLPHHPDAGSPEVQT